MSDNVGGVYLGIPLGSKYGSKLTLGGPDVNAVLKHLADLNEIDENDPDGISAINYVLDGLLVIEAAVALKMPNSQPAATSSAPSGAVNVTPQPEGATPLCTTHNLPMTWVSDGIVKSGSNAGKHYSAWKCTAPYTPGVKCSFKDFTIKG